MRHCENAYQAQAKACTVGAVGSLWSMLHTPSIAVALHSMTPQMA